jgi:hypothetical protein
VRDSLLSQPGGFEGFGAIAKEAELGHLALSQRPKRSDVLREISSAAESAPSRTGHNQDLFSEVPEFLWVDAELGKRFEEEPDCLEEPIVPVMDGGLGLIWNIMPFQPCIEIGESRIRGPHE